MNTITIADIKRSGMHAIDTALQHGPVHLMKRNRRAAVVLSEAQYAQLLAQAAAHPSMAVTADAALALFLADQPAGTLDVPALAARLDDAHGAWGAR
ncbi:hypothetical protein PY257_14805 [Ramlibacter sp. H39-3-26]|uniref:hypothetical protein n=1 Tax=Curvibacter soli TaxID=3031331 RepID=UPI0023DB7FE5|nr:hypothetical protein [Ramlibacter sp. H39-3-26]MDF1486432.1 hypothetical protein [Ramlibacter sp. H39-3-26]